MVPSDASTLAHTSYWCVLLTTGCHSFEWKKVYVSDKLLSNHVPFLCYSSPSHPSQKTKGEKGEEERINIKVRF